MGMYDLVECVNNDPVRTAISEAAKSQRDHYKVEIKHYGLYEVTATNVDGVVSYAARKLQGGLYDEYLKLENERRLTTTAPELVEIDKKMLKILSRIT